MDTALFFLTINLIFETVNSYSTVRKLLYADNVALDRNRRNASPRCLNGGHFVKLGLGEFRCECKAGFSGTYCEDESVILSDEKRLIKKLLDDYDEVGVVGRPVYNTSDTIKVGYGLSLIQILDLDEKNQILTTNVWSRYKWRDVLLKWNSTDYGDLRQIRVPVNKIWTPDIVLYNYADERLKEQRPAMAVVSYDGTVEWLPPSIYKSTCLIDIANFPYDEQKCKMKFGSWTYDGTKVDVAIHEEGAVQTDDYVESKEWYLKIAIGIRNEQYYEGLELPYPDVTFTIVIKRVAMFYSYILVLPCVLLSSLTLVTFWLPPESPAKVMIGMNIFVAFFILLIMLSESTPPAASKIPLIGQYFCMNMVLITLSTFLAVVIIQTHIRGDRKNKVPLWLKKIAIDNLARVLCMDEYLEKETTVYHSSTKSSHGVITFSTDYHKKKYLNSPYFKSQNINSGSLDGTFDQPAPAAAREVSINNDQPVHVEASPSIHNTSAHNLNLDSDVKEIKRLLKCYLSRLESKDIQAKNAKEWRLVARVIDRLFFFSYVATIVVSLTMTFPNEETE